MSVRGWIPAAVLLSLVSWAGSASASCEEDVADLERVAPTLGLSVDSSREAEALRTEAAVLCDQGDGEGASAKVDQAWRTILDDEGLVPRTVVEVASAPCSDGLERARSAVDGPTEVGEVGRSMARLLIDDAAQLCEADDEMAAELKLSLAMNILTE